MYAFHDHHRGALTALALLLLLPAIKPVFAHTSLRPMQGVLAPDSLLTSSNLPLIVINTHGQYIPDEPKIDAEMGIIDNGAGMRNHLGDPFNSYHGRIGIEVRGSSSQAFPKKQFAVETRDSLGNDIDVSLLGLPAESDWVLLASYNDKSLIRDVLVYQLARGLGRYASRSRYCELVLNGDYMGVYVLLEKIKRNKNRVSITKMTQADTSGDALTGGYIFKIDKFEGSNVAGWYSGFPTPVGAIRGIYYQFHYPDQNDLVEAQRGYLTRYVRDFEIAMYLSTPADSVQAYMRLLDIDSFVDGMLLNELSKNVDAYRLSTFLYKDRDSKGGKIVMGPLWDYNAGLGNCDYYDASVIEGFQLQYLTTPHYPLGADQYQVAFWWKKLFDDPGFQHRLRERWTVLSKDLCSPARIGGMIDSLTTLLGEAQQRNFLRWPILGVYIWPNAFIGRTYAEEIDHLRTWMAARIHWLDTALSVTSTDMPGIAPPSEAGTRLLQNYPNPFNGSSEFGFRISQWADVKVQVFDLLGREVAVLVNERKAPGAYSVRFSANGGSLSSGRQAPSGGDASGLSSGVYFYRLIARPLEGASGEIFVETRKLVVAK